MVQHDNKVRRYNGQSIEVDNAGRKNSVEVLYEKRNPYLLDYEEERRKQAHSQRKADSRQPSTVGDRESSSRRTVAGYAEGVNRRSAVGYEEGVNRRNAVAYGEDVNCRSVIGYEEDVNRRSAVAYGKGMERHTAVGDRETVNRQNMTRYNEAGYRRSAASDRESINRRGTVEYRETDNGRTTAGNRKSSSRRTPAEDTQQSNRRILTGYAQSSSHRTPTGHTQSSSRRTPAGHTQSSNRRSAVGYTEESNPSVAARHAAKHCRRKRILMQRMAIGIWALCILCLAVTLLARNNRASAAGQDQKENQTAAINGVENVPPKQLDTTQSNSILVQGIPATEFAKHPEWTEDFLTPNEYSRPGDALESVTNIFVHYTANPGTSAAQNRSYFERQKDEHLASVSAHFIIGYEGEIIQCVPLDEIAYAVKSRNYDSISIECCHLEKDGSFTRETYDSLIALLRWLLDVYDLESEDILRHYDCGGKKCPLYFTEHPDAWEELKKDVDKL